MKLYLAAILTIVSLASGEADEDLNAMFITMERSSFVEHFNGLNYTWKVKQYPNIFSRRSFDNSITAYGISDLPFKVHDPNVVGELPDYFDSRVKWSQCESISKIFDQKYCESCWAHGVANTASDRICIHNHIPVELSEQDLECAHPNHTICHSGATFQGFIFWRDVGLVTRTCKPYNPDDLNRRVCELRCEDPMQDYNQDKHFAQEVYQIPKDDYQIKAELVSNGPIEAAMKTYEDFSNKEKTGYASGIYVHTHGNFTGVHMVRVIGYGVENGVDYWLVANSWGSDWGEHGLFRIKRFQESLYFEDAMFTGLPKPVGSY